MNGVPSTPYYILYEDKLRENLKLINKVSSESGVEIILAFKAFALWKTFDIFKEYICSTTASSPFEAKLANDYFGSLAHTYSPAYEENTFNTILFRNILASTTKLKIGTAILRTITYPQE